MAARFGNVEPCALASVRQRAHLSDGEPRSQRAHHDHGDGHGHGGAAKTHRARRTHERGEGARQHGRAYDGEQEDEAHAGESEIREGNDEERRHDWSRTPRCEERQEEQTRQDVHAGIKSHGRPLELRDLIHRPAHARQPEG